MHSTTKVLRLADAVRSLCLGGHGRECGGPLRSQLQAFANLKFIHRYEQPEAAAARFISYTRDVRQRMKPHIVREPRESEVFSTMTEEEWDQLETEAKADEQRIAEAMKERKIEEMKPFRIRLGKDDKPLPPVDSWTGMTDAELFEYVKEQDLYRFYVLFSNEIHANAGGLGSLLREVNQGVANINDREDVLTSVGLASRSALRTVEFYSEHFGLGIDAEVTEIWKRWEGDFSANTALQRATSRA